MKELSLGEGRELASEGKKSLQHYQDVYNQITGKSEKIFKMLFDAHAVNINHLEGLHQELERALEQWQNATSHCSITVRFIDHSVCRHSGFNRFKLDCPNSTQATESIEIEYDFLVLLPKTQEAKPYKLTIGLRSTLGVMARLKKEDVTEAERDMFYEFGSGTAKVEISYVDLAVARSLEAIVLKWYETLPRTGQRGFRQKIRNTAKPVQTFFRVLAVFSCVISFWYFSVDRIGSLGDLLKSILVFAGYFSTIWLIAMAVGPNVRRIVLRLSPYSVVELCSADNSLIAQQKNEPMFVTLRTVGYCLGSVALGLLSGYLGHLTGF